MILTDSNGNTVSATGDIEVRNPDPWCQAKDGDVFASNGSVFCQIPSSCSLNPPCDPYIITYDSSISSPGVAAASGSVGTGQTHYQAAGNSSTNFSNYDFTFFNDRVGSNAGTISGSNITQAVLTGLPTYAGYRWGRYSGGSPATIDTDVNLGTERVVLLVDSDLDVSAKVNFTKGRGFFLAIVSGDINVAPSVTGPVDTTPDLEGIYFAEGSFNTVSLGPDISGNPQDSPLHVRGTVVAGDFTLDRNLPDNSGLAAEYFEYGADLVLQFPAVLSRKQVIWREVAP